MKVSARNFAEATLPSETMPKARGREREETDLPRKLQVEPETARARRWECVSLAGLESLMEAAKRDLVSLEALLLAMLEMNKGTPSWGFA